MQNSNAWERGYDKGYDDAFHDRDYASIEQNPFGDPTKDTTPETISDALDEVETMVREYQGMKFVYLDDIRTYRKRRGFTK